LTFFAHFHEISILKTKKTFLGFHFKGAINTGFLENHLPIHFVEAFYCSEHFRFSVLQKWQIDVIKLVKILSTSQIL
jgi:hypothetical protein